MRIRKLALSCCMVIMFLVQVKAQNSERYKFGQISSADFNLNADKFDSGANVVIIADIGSTKFEGNNKLFFTMVFTRLLRVKIMNKNGLRFGNQRISLYHDEQNEEKITMLRGSTFNLENGIIKETKLDEKSIFDERFNKNRRYKKFSMPALTEGSIFDLEYTVKSPFEFELRPWEFQGDDPRIWSEYTVTIPSFYHYVMLLQGDEQFDINTTKDVPTTYVVEDNNIDMRNEQYQVNSTSIQKHWVKKNVPSLREEPFTTTLKNYTSKVFFQLNYFQLTSQSDRHDFLNTWPVASKTLLADKNFGEVLNTDNDWIDKELQPIVRGDTSADSRMISIYAYVRDNFKKIGVEGYGADGIYAFHNLKEIFTAKQGNAAEINLLLIALLRRAGIHADPLILSTRDNGVVHMKYPIIEEYNYVICFARTFNTAQMLDASQPYSGFAQLPTYCYNGWGHIINDTTPLPVFFADSTDQSSIAMVIMVNDAKGITSGSFSKTLGRSDSYDLREEIAKTSKNIFESKIQTSYESGTEIENLEIDSLRQFDYPVTLRYDFTLGNIFSGSTIYFNPMLTEASAANPFNSQERHYPVEMTFLTDKSYFLRMDIPAGYEVEELPKPEKFTLNETEGSYEYLIQNDANSLQLRVHLKLNKTVFPVEGYAALRDFFALVVKKENEKVVFRKIP